MDKSLFNKLQLACSMLFWTLGKQKYQSNSPSLLKEFMVRFGWSGQVFLILFIHWLKTLKLSFLFLIGSCRKLDDFYRSLSHIIDCTRGSGLKKGHDAYKLRKVIQVHGIIAFKDYMLSAHWIFQEKPRLHIFIFILLNIGN